MTESKPVVFYAHPKQDDDPEADVGLLVDVFRTVRDVEVDIVPARDDYKAHAREHGGGWKSWAQSVSEAAGWTGRARYAAIVVPSTRVGRDTAAVLGPAFDRGMQVWVWGREAGTLERAVGLVVVDRDDWTSGWLLDTGAPL